MAINLTDITFYYPSRPNVPVLNIPSWTLPTAEQAFIYGPSGLGKSTLLNLLSGILPPSKGKLDVFGQRLDKMTNNQRDRFRANNIGYVFQQFNLIPYLNAIDNIRLASYLSQQTSKSHLDNEVKQLLVTLNLQPEDWQVPTRNLSLGQQQRVAIARALINKPKLLIADEPTSSLDQANRDAFMAMLMSAVTENGITLLFVSHDMSLAKNFNRVEALSDINCI